MLAGLAVGLATGISYSRVFLGARWLTDVIGGLFIGWAWFAVCSVALGGRQLKSSISLPRWPATKFDHLQCRSARTIDSHDANGDRTHQFVLLDTVPDAIHGQLCHHVPLLVHSRTPRSNVTGPFVRILVDLRGVAVYLKRVAFGTVSMMVIHVIGLFGLTVNVKCIAFGTVLMLRDVTLCVLELPSPFTLIPSRRRPL